MMLDLPRVRDRPLCIALTGPNGAGKSTFYQTQLEALGYPFVNADNLSRQLGMEAYEAAKAADNLRRELVRQRTSFVFETVFSDPVADKVTFLEEVERAGYQVVLCYIGLSSAGESDRRVSMRVSKGGHDVPRRKIKERYPRTLANLKLAIDRLSDVRVFDNEDLARPYRLVARCGRGTLLEVRAPVPRWAKPILPKG